MWYVHLFITHYGTWQGGCKQTGTSPSPPLTWFNMLFWGSLHLPDESGGFSCTVLRSQQEAAQCEYQQLPWLPWTWLRCPSKVSLTLCWTFSELGKWGTDGIRGRWVRLVETLVLPASFLGNGLLLQLLSQCLSRRLCGALPAVDPGCFELCRFSSVPSPCTLPGV